MSESLNRPRALEPGDLVALVAPSRPASERGPRQAAAYLEQRGYRVDVSPPSTTGISTLREPTKPAPRS